MAINQVESFYFFDSWASSKAKNLLTCIAGVALLIIGCMGAAGVLPGATIGFATVGLAGGALVLNLAKGSCTKRKIELITVVMIAAALITVGALGGAGILSPGQVGLGTIGTLSACIPLSCVLFKFDALNRIHNTMLDEGRKFSAKWNQREFQNPEDRNDLKSFEAKLVNQLGYTNFSVVETASLAQKWQGNQSGNRYGISNANFDIIIQQIIKERQGDRS